jgi:hypothetical protein
MGIFLVETEQPIPHGYSPDMPGFFRLFRDADLVGVRTDRASPTVCKKDRTANRTIPVSRA